jgi:hypothetical protein
MSAGRLQDIASLLETQTQKGRVCQEADRRLQSAKKNKRANKNSGEKAERRNQRKQEKPESPRVDEIDDLRENAEA